jgi:hypothetical protein
MSTAIPAFSGFPRIYFLQIQEKINIPRGRAADMAPGPPLNPGFLFLSIIYTKNSYFIHCW